MTTHASRQPSTGSPESPGRNGQPDTFAISNAVVKVHKQLFGRGPTKARTTIDGEVIVCTLDDGLTRSEALMLEAGEHDLVRRMREALYEVARPQMVDAVEAVVGQPVASYCGSLDVSCGVQVVVFTLGR